MSPNEVSPSEVSPSEVSSSEMSYSKVWWIHKNVSTFVYKHLYIFLIMLYRGAGESLSKETNYVIKQSSSLSLISNYLLMKPGFN